MKKPRSDSKLDGLPRKKLGQLIEGLLGGWSYEAARSWLQTECALSCSLSALSGFFKRHCAPVLKERRQLAVLRAEAIASDAGVTDWDAASIEKLRQMVFEFMSDPNANIEATERMFRLLLKSRDQEVDRRKLAILETKARDAKAKLDAVTTAAKSQGGLTAETLKQIEEAAGLL